MGELWGEVKGELYGMERVRMHVDTTEEGAPFSYRLRARKRPAPCKV